VGRVDSNARSLNLHYSFIIPSSGQIDGSLIEHRPKSSDRVGSDIYNDLQRIEFPKFLIIPQEFEAAAE
jgi:hypothetical protein